MVPHLITALTGPINELEQRVLDSMPAIERWFRLEWMEHTPPFYASVDVRNAGFKLAPVDTNLFPSGWHNLTPEMMPLAVQAAMAAIEKICPEARNLLMIPENGKPSSFYLESLAQLQRIFNMAGLNVRLGSIDPAVKKATSYELQNGDTVTLEPVIRGKRRLGLKDFDPCTILLNNDLMAGVPGIVEEIFEQYLLPPLHAGWPTRRMSSHYKAYEEVAKRLGKLMGVDPWLINPLFEKCEEVELERDKGLDCLSAQVDLVLTRVRRKYSAHSGRHRCCLRRHRHQRSVCGQRGLRLRPRPVHSRQRLRHPVHLLLDADRHRLAQVRGAGAACRQPTAKAAWSPCWRWPRNPSKTNPNCASGFWLWASLAPACFMAMASSRRPFRCCRR
jgi:hypothetical protein